MRHTKGHTRNRRSHHSLEASALTTDKDTGAPHLRHRASSVTGTYKGRQVIDVEKKALKKAQKVTEASQATPTKEDIPKEEKKVEAI